MPNLFFYADTVYLPRRRPAGFAVDEGQTGMRLGFIDVDERQSGLRLGLIDVDEPQNGLLSGFIDVDEPQNRLLLPLIDAGVIPGRCHVRFPTFFLVYPMADQLPPTPGDDEPDTKGWIAPTEVQRAQQLLDAHPHLVAAGLELKWFPNADVLTHATAHKSATIVKSGTVAQRPAQTDAMKAAMKEMAKPLKELRGVMKKKFKEAYEGYYPQFGLVETGGEWKLPYDRDVLVIALKEKLLPALITYGFDKDADTGTDVWTPLLNKLQAGLTTAATLDSTRSTQVATTDAQDDKTTLALQSLVHLVKAHYPPTWESVLRGWNWRKTSF